MILFGVIQLAKQHVTSDVILLFLTDFHRRFQRSLNNLFELYLPLSDRWSVLDNASGRLEVIASGTARRTFVKDSEKWLLLQSIAP